VLALVRKFNVDSRRIYLMGHSRGAGTLLQSIRASGRP
jgi:predicted peptidase